MLSDEKAASKRIAAFAESDDRWMVAVRMVSEGVDVPRLAVGVYATTTTTPLFFAQAVGRFVRARKRGETASVFLPSTGHLLGLAAEMEVQRDHVLGRPVTSDDDIFAAEEAAAGPRAGGRGRLRRGAAAAVPGARLRGAVFDRVLYDGGEFGHAGEVHVGSDEEMDFLGIPGLLEPDQVRDLLRHRQSERARKQAEPASSRRDHGAASRPSDRLCTSGSASSGASSTGWSPPGTTAPASRTASPMRRCARSAAGRRRRSRPPTSCRRGSTGSGPGRPAADRHG